jgi:hypothetical protein
VVERDSQLFGTRNRTMILIAIRLLEETYVSELAAMLSLRHYSVQSALAAFEKDAVVVSRQFGRTRRVMLNPRYFAFDELSRLLWKLGEADAPLQKMLAARRRRPRRVGKPGL